MTWYLDYLGKPWAPVPDPPASYNCAMLCASVYKDRFGIDVGAMTHDARTLKDSLAGFSEAASAPDIWGLELVPAGERPREFDTVFMARSRFEDHCGILASTPDGPLILHCIKDAGVVLDTPLDMALRGFSRLTWYRRKGIEWAGHTT